MELSPSFIEQVSQNKYFKIVDAVTGRSISWLDVAEQALPTKKGQLAFLYLDNSIESIIAFFRFYISGAAVALLPKTLQADRKQQLENNYRPALIFDKTRETVIGFSEINNGGLAYFQTVNTELSPQVHQKIKILLSTSGTTGSPKLVKLSEENLLSNAASIISYLPINTKDVTPLNLPIYYSYGLSILTTHALAGGTMVCGLADVIQKEFWQQWEQFGFTSLAGVPFTYEMLDRLDFFKKELPTLTYFTQAGGRLSGALVTKAAMYAIENNKRFFVMYGQTEATARMAYLPPANTLQKPTSIGIAIPGGKFSIDADTQELLYSGKNVFGGYAEASADLANFEANEILRTGDIAQMDEDGYVYITGRLKRFVKLFGNRIGLDEMEDIIKTQFNLQPLACNGFNDKYLLVSYVDDTTDTKIITAFLFANFGLHPTAIRWNLLTALPLTANGKIDYQQIITEHAGI